MCLNEDGLWISYKNLIKCYRVRRDGRLQEMSGRTLRGHQDDITRYRCRDNITVSAGRYKLRHRIKFNSAVSMFEQSQFMVHKSSGALKLNHK